MNIGWYVRGILPGENLSSNELANMTTYVSFWSVRSFSKVWGIVILASCINRPFFRVQEILVQHPNNNILIIPWPHMDIKDRFQTILQMKQIVIEKVYYKKLSNLVCFIEEAVASARRKYSWLSKQVETILADLIPLVQ